MDSAHNISEHDSEGPISQTVIHKHKETGDILVEKSMKFKIQRASEMNIKIKGKDKSKRLQLDRSTVMVMHLVNLDRRMNTIEETEKSTFKDKMPLR